MNAKSTVTLELLNNARELINDFIEGSATVNTDTSAWPPFDEKVLRVQKQFVCRVCKVSDIFGINVNFVAIFFNGI